MTYLTIKEAAELWEITEQMVRRYCREGRVSGAVHREGNWYVPKGVARPKRKKKSAVVVATPKFVKQLQRQRTKKVSQELYDYIQINLCYSSNRMASNRLMLKQVEEVFKKGKVSTGFEPIKVDDLIEAYNHFVCFNYILDTATTRISQTYIRKLHTMLIYGTAAERRQRVHPGEYRKVPCTIGKTKTTPPKNINSQLSALISEYENQDKVELIQILAFHVRFECIHPFEDGNGRIGRLLMFKECLRHEIMPFIIDNKHRGEYNRGIVNWSSNPVALLVVAEQAQKRFQNQKETLELMEYCRPATGRGAR